MGVYRSFILDDIDFATRVNVFSIERDLMPPIYDDLLYIQGRSGAYDANGGQDDVLYITMLIEVTDEHGAGTLRTKARELASLLRRKEVKQLICGDEPDKFNWARVSGRSEWKEIANVGTGKIVFLCPDPFAYSTDEHETEFTNDVATVENAGTQETHPRVVAVFIAPTTFFSLSIPGKQLLLGDPTEIDIVSIPEQELILHDTCSTITGWTTGIVPEEGNRAGSMISQGGKFVVTGYGSGSDWHGPSLKRSFPGLAMLDSFQVDVLLEHRNIISGPGGQGGQIELYLLNEADGVVGKACMMDNTRYAERNFPWGRVGNKPGNVRFPPFSSDGGPYNWRPFGLGGDVHFLRIKRKKVNGNQYIWTMMAGWYDVLSGQYPFIETREYHSFPPHPTNSANEVAQICVHIGAHGTTPPVPASINDIKVYRLNDPGVGQIPYIANAGDVIEVNHATGRIRRNGEDAMHLYAPSTEFFALPPGETEIKVQPTGVAIVKLYHRDCWK